MVLELILNAMINETKIKIKIHEIFKAYTTSLMYSQKHSKEKSYLSVLFYFLKFNGVQ
jgi:hypothetical protein